MLTLPIYLFQISDRVLTSRSFDTLVMLSLSGAGLSHGPVAAGYLCVARSWARLATRLDTRLGGPLLASVIIGSGDGSGNVQTLRSLHQVQQLHLQPGHALLLFDAPLRQFTSRSSSSSSPTLGFLSSSRVRR